ncbi:15997_t:CDS:2, partial [Gigaspora rosea]
LDCKIIELTDEFGKNIHYHLHEDELQSDNSSEYQNGFDIIMRSAWSILNIANWIQRHEGGWSTQKLADSEEKQFIIALSEALWYIDIHDSTKLEERSFHISNLFYEFLGKANPESYKESRKPFDASELNLHCQTLISYATSTWIRSSKFNWLYDAYDKLIVAISNYVNFLHRQREITASNHANEVPIRSIEKAASKPISLEKYLPTELKQRLRFIQGLSQAFTFRIGEYRYNSGNGTYNSIFVWKVEEGASEAKLVQETTRITSELQNDVPQYHTRIMRANYLANTMKDIREIAESNPTLKAELIKSIQDPINLVLLSEQHHEIDKTPDELNCNNNEVESAPSPSYSYSEQDINDIENDES